jgi:1,3-beta-glucanosyltransferase GAS1
MEGYTSYSNQMKSIAPSSTNAASYTPTNLNAAACPTQNSTWDVSTNLPPTPDEALCQCMSSSVACGPNSGLSAQEVGTLLGVVCGLSSSACGGIDANGSTGVYGPYSPCDASAQLAYALNAYYEEQSSQGNGASACDFSGSATLQSATTPTSCTSQLSAASVQATATGSSASGSGSAASSSTSKAAAASAHLHSAFSISNGLQLGLYLFVALTTGVFMVIL